MRAQTARRLTAAEVGHLRRLLGYVCCGIGQSPDELVALVQELAPAMGPVSDGGKSRLVEAHQKAESVPRYVRAAVKALEKVVREADAAGTTVEGEAREVEALPGSRT